MKFILGDPLVYWILKFITFFALLYSGYKISFKLDENNSKQYWRYSLPALIIYSLNYGLRWNRSYDYYHYYLDLTSDNLWTDYDEPLYLLWIDFFKFTELPYWVAFIFYSAILMYGFMLLLKKYPKAAVWALPLFFILPSNVDNFVRQYFATAFVFIGLYYLLEDKYKRSFLNFTLAILIHLSALFAVFLIIIFKFVNIQKIIRTPWLLIVLYLLLYVFWDVSNLGFFATYLQLVNIGDSNFQGYIDNSEVWFTEDGDINTKLGVSGVGYFSAFSALIYRFVTCFVLYYGYKLLQFDRKTSILYWSTVVSVFIGAVGGSIEIFSRFVCWTVIYEPLIIGLIINSLGIPRMSRKIFIILVLFYFYGIQFVWGISKLSPLGYAFIWDL